MCKLVYPKASCPGPVESEAHMAPLDSSLTDSCSGFDLPRTGTDLPSKEYDQVASFNVVGGRCVIEERRDAIFSVGLNRQGTEALIATLQGMLPHLTEDGEEEIHATFL